MSTELFRKYIDILKEDSQEMVISTVSDITRLKIALQELEAVLDKYQDRINEDQKVRAQNRLLEIDLSQMSREQIEALRQGGSLPPRGSKEAQAWQAELDASRASQSTPSSGTVAKEPGTASKFLSKNPTIRKILAKGRGSAIRGGAWGTGAFVAYEILTNLYDWITSKKLDDLRPGDQEIIKKNIPIIQPWTAPDKIKTLDQDLRFRLLHVVDLLGKLGMSLAAQSSVVQNEEVAPASDQPEAPDQQVDQKLLDLLDRAYAQIDESTHIDMKRFVLQNMHLLSEAEQMAVRRDMLSEIDIPDWVNPSNWPVWAQIAGGAGAYKYGPDIVKKGYNAVTDNLPSGQARIEAEIEAAKKAAEATAAQTTAAIDAANQENARITTQNAEAERQWRTKSPATRGPRPTPKPLVPVPEMPAAFTAPKRGPMNKGAAAIGRWKIANPKKVALAAAATGLGGMVLWLTAAVKGTVAAVDAGMTAADDAVKAQATELENDLELFRQAARNTDEQLAGTLLQNPEDYLRFAKRVMRHCSKFPNTPDCQDRMDRLCADPVLTNLNGGPLAGC
jgi:hypothetical protein